MSYLDAPQTKMLATHCCVCGRPLCDARSVEMGIGPECRGGLEGGISEGQRELCNKLTWAASIYATQGNVKKVRECADACRAAGLTGLGDLIEARFKNAEKNARIKMWNNLYHDRIVFETPFRRGERDNFLRDLRAIPSRKYHGDGRNSVSKSDKRLLWEWLKKYFPGDYGTMNDKEVFRVCSAS